MFTSSLNPLLTLPDTLPPLFTSSLNPSLTLAHSLPLLHSSSPILTRSHPCSLNHLFTAITHSLPCSLPPPHSCPHSLPYSQSLHCLTRSTTPILLLAYSLEQSLLYSSLLCLPVCLINTPHSLLVDTQQNSLT